MSKLIYNFFSYYEETHVTKFVARVNNFKYEICRDSESLLSEI